MATITSISFDPVTFQVRITSHEMTPDEKAEARRRAMDEAYERHDLINAMRSLAFDIIEDGVITLDEALEIKRAFNMEGELKKDALFRPIWLQVRNLKKSSVLSEDDKVRLFDDLRRVIDPTHCTDGEIFDEINGKTFCLTGDFSYGSRKAVEERLVSLGGISKKGVSRSLDYLIVGTKGSDDYAYGNYGSKVKQAMEYQNKGLPILIVPEREFGPLRQ